MYLPIRLSAYLSRCDAAYEICEHRHSRGSSQTARTARVPLHQLAKAVIVEDDAGCVMGVVPGDRYVRLGRLSELLGRRHLRLADEERVAALFPDCDRGAVPALGMVWGLQTVVDDDLEVSDMVYLECGDHERLLKVTRDQFQALMQPALHGRFSDLRIH